MGLRKREGTGNRERTYRSQFVGSWRWKRLWTCRKADCAGSRVCLMYDCVLYCEVGIGGRQLTAVHVTRNVTVNMLIVHWHCLCCCQTDRHSLLYRLDSTNMQMKLDVFSINSFGSTEVVVNFKTLMPFILNYSVSVSRHSVFSLCFKFSDKILYIFLFSHLRILLPRSIL